MHSCAKLIGALVVLNDEVRVAALFVERHLGFLAARHLTWLPAAGGHGAGIPVLEGGFDEDEVVAVPKEAIGRGPFGQHLGARRSFIPLGQGERGLEEKGHIDNDRGLSIFHSCAKGLPKSGTNDGVDPALKVLPGGHIPEDDPA